MTRQTATERLIWAQGSPATLKAISTTIKGVRINLAAAICWENYMPLLRQSLYAQNINLYLAPTADGRDTWLSLMRTVGIEGRCFVVTSNMCIRDKTQDSSAVNGQQQHDEETEETSRQDRVSNSTKRRNSCLTEDGFEIALPSPTPHKSKSNRRRSVFDEDGNEIVLCHKEDDEEGASAHEKRTSSRQSLVKQMTSQANAIKAKGSFISRGGSSIVSPFGDVIAGPQWEDEDGIIFADVDFDDCIRGRLDLDTAGSYSR
jgi:nitrilase